MYRFSIGFIICTAGPMGATLLARMGPPWRSWYHTAERVGVVLIPSIYSSIPSCFPPGEYETWSALPGNSGLLFEDSELYCYGLFGWVEKEPRRRCPRH